MSGAGQVECKIGRRIMPSDASLRLGKMRMGHCQWRYIWKEKVQSTFKVLHKVFFACHADHCWQLLFLSEDVRSTGSIWEWPPLDSDCGLSVWWPRERAASGSEWEPARRPENHQAEPSGAHLQCIRPQILRPSTFSCSRLFSTKRQSMFF